MSRIYFIFIFSVLFSSGCIANKVSSSERSINDSLLKVAALESEVAPIISKEYEITVLTPDDILLLSGKYPVIYGSLPNKTLYRLDFKGERGMLVIVDLENRKVLKYFRTAGVSLQ